MWRRSPDRTLLAGVVNDRLLIQSKVKNKKREGEGEGREIEQRERKKSNSWFFMLPFIRDEMWWTPEHKGRCEGTDRKEGPTSRSFLYPPPAFFCSLLSSTLSLSFLLL